jgi:predicted CXXCH cytochrome family protein
MKKSIVIFAALAMIVGFASSSFAVITSSSHDLSGSGEGSTELCVYCHVPHNPLAQSADSPLWNRGAPAANGTFILYDGTAAQDASTVSGLCLSCHDGVTNLGAFGVNAGVAPIGAVPANVGADLQDDHPVMVAIPVGAGYNTAAAINAGTTAKIYGTDVECASCHDPHLTDNGKFLRADNTNSDLCLACHDK